MFGFNLVSEVTSCDKYKYDIIAETDGILAMLPLGEIKTESRKNPQATYRILYLAAK